MLLWLLSLLKLGTFGNMMSAINPKYASAATTSGMVVISNGTTSVSTTPLG